MTFPSPVRIVLSRLERVSGIMVFASIRFSTSESSLLCKKHLLLVFCLRPRVSRLTKTQWAREEPPFWLAMQCELSHSEGTPSRRRAARLTACRRRRPAPRPRRARRRRRSRRRRSRAARCARAARAASTRRTRRCRRAPTPRA